MELYLHFPFCAKKCRYCDFASYAGCEDIIPAYVEAVLQEARARAEQLGRNPMETVFLGGGTPSLLPAPYLDRLLNGVNCYFPVQPGAECTSEANPGTLNRPWLDTAVSHGINRLSLGMQAYQQALLAMLGRIHNFAQVERSVTMAREAGINSISLDLMFGLPGQTPDQWRETLQAALSLHPQHLSCYGLIPEEGTPLKADLDAGRLSLPGEDVERAMYDDALTILADAGFVQYEISNFALPGYACRHNLGYWRQVPYLGLGAAASSMLPAGNSAAYLRETNPPRLSDYMEMVQGLIWNQREQIAVSPAEARFETMMLGLRTTEGVSEAFFEAMHGVTLEACYGNRLRALAHEGLVRHAEGCWRLTRRGMDVQNAVLVELMDD